MKKLTARQRRFVEEYLVDLNGTQAAIRAGYSTKSAKQQSDQNLARENIKAAIDKAMAERSKRTGINADRIIMELAKIALANASDLANFDEATVKDEATRDDTAAIQSIRVKRIPTQDGCIIEREVKLYDKIRALELLGKHFNMFKDNVNLMGALAVKIVDDIGADSEE
jgi:phage terminase small subunit